MSYKRFYVTGSLSILGIFILIAPFIQYYSEYSDVVCGDKCWTTFCMKNGNKDLYFYNYEELPLTFSPESKVYDVKFYKKDGRYKSGYRPIDFITPYSKGVKYVFKIPAYSYTCYGMEVIKQPAATVKWSFIGLDPLLIGIGANMSYDINSRLNSTLGQNFAPNWSIIMAQLNFSVNATMAGNYTWNLTEYNISTNSTLNFTYVFRNNGSSNITVMTRINGTYNGYYRVWFWNGSRKEWNVTNSSWLPMFNLTVNGTRRHVNVTLDLLNISQTYKNWTLNTTSNTANWSFRIAFNVSAY